MKQQESRSVRASPQATSERQNHFDNRIDSASTTLEPELMDADAGLSGVEVKLSITSLQSLTPFDPPQNPFCRQKASPKNRKATETITVTQKLLVYHKAHYGLDLSCYACGLPISLGEKAVRRICKHSLAPSKTKYHHLNCFARF